MENHNEQQSNHIGSAEKHIEQTQTVAEKLLKEKDIMLKKWLQTVREEIAGSKDKTDEEIYNHVGSFLDSLIQALNQFDWAEDYRKTVSQNHGKQRFRYPDYTLDQIIREYLILRKTIFEYLAEDLDVHINEGDRLVIHSFIDKGIEEASNQFINLQAETLELAAKQASLLDAASDYMWLVDRDHKFTYVSHSLANVWGVSMDSLIGENISGQIYDTDLLEKLKAEIDMAFDGRRVSGETWYISPAGVPRYFQYSISPSAVEKGIITSVSVVSKEISEQKKIQLQLAKEQKKLNDSKKELELALKERDESLRTLSIVNRIGQNFTSKLEIEKIVQSVTDAATELSGAEFGIFFCSEEEKNDDSENESALYAVSGLPKERFKEFANVTAKDIFYQTFAGRGTVRVDDIKNDPHFDHFAHLYGFVKNSINIKSYLGVSVVSRNGEALGGLFLGHKESGIFTKQDEEIVEGLTSQAAIAMDNAKLYQKLQDSIKARDTFLSIASHELKTPLTSLILQSQMRRRQIDKGNDKAFSIENLSKMFEADNKQLGKLNRLVDDMLDISRMRMGKLSLNKEKIDICHLVKDVYDRFLPQLEEACSEVHFVPCEGIFVAADPYRFEQVLTNLLTNAMKYGQGKPLEIKLNVVTNNKEGKKKACLSVIDHGIGISEKDQKRIFSRFERAVSPNEISGLGLGLAIAKDIIEAHGGVIHLHSILGDGSTFSVELPLI